MQQVPGPGGDAHTDVDRALEAALTLDIPFWPQLPNYYYYEDMYVQAAEHFPVIVLNLEKKTLRFSNDRFVEKFEKTMAHFEDPDLYAFLTERVADRFHRNGPIAEHRIGPYLITGIIGKCGYSIVQSHLVHADNPVGKNIHILYKRISAAAAKQKIFELLE